MENVRNAARSIFLSVSILKLLQGNWKQEYTYETDTGAMAVMADEQEALRDLMLFNEMCTEDFIPDYGQTAFWGYPPNGFSVIMFDDKEWSVSDYYKDGYTVPFGQLILVEGGTHWARKPHAQLAWDFMRQFRRNEQGKIEQLQQ